MKFSVSKRSIKRKLGTLMVFVMVSSFVMPAYADDYGIPMSLNNPVSSEGFLPGEAAAEKMGLAVPEVKDGDKQTEASRDIRGGGIWGCVWGTGRI